MKYTGISLIDKVSKRLLELEFKSNYITNALKGVVKMYCHHYKTWFKTWKRQDKEIMKNKVTTEKSRCFNGNHKLIFIKQHKKVNIESPKFFISYKTYWLIV